MVRNIVITEEKKDGRISYGLRITENGNTVCYSELTGSREKIEQLKRNLLNSDISAVHIGDIVRDFIAEDACDKLLMNSLL